MKITLFTIFLTIFICSINADGKVSSGRKTQTNSDLSIKIKLERGITVDSIWLQVYENPISDLAISFLIAGRKETNGDYYFILENLKHPIYISLFKDFTELHNPLPFFHLYLAEPGDNIDIYIKKDSTLKLAATTFRTFLSTSYSKNYLLRFSGIGSAKFQCRYAIERGISADRTSGVFFDTDGNLSASNHYETSHRLCEAQLSQFKNRISRIAYETIQVDFFSIVELERLQSFIYSYPKESLQRLKLLNLYQNKIDRMLSGYPENAKTFSAVYPEFVVQKERILKCIKIQRKLSALDNSEIYYALKNKLTGPFRDKVLTYLLVNYSKNLDVQELTKDALLTIREEFCIELIKSISRIAKGLGADNFSLPNTLSKFVNLSDFRGKVVFIDFWFTGCGGCINYYKNVLSRVEEEFKNDSNVVFVSISIDANPKTWLKSIREGIYTSQQVVNLYTNGLGAEHPVIRNYNVSGYPSPLLIDKNGIFLEANYDDLRSANTDTLISKIKKAIQ